ncbi:hemolysin D [Terasakiispira papahanaumokuakeensis]|uniref:Hemolysin D n=1 Tax=Terasakiispira papahanaumokuakeensis TaxID=197479 RepID=A0A1E2V7V1_9GAMM|nr:HlyD family secretion protein [Terasakiispira papahanaumokuakeensis]ODC02993.1 hemolysin D [Terasakiispira papahanaumokuakeensis]
MTPEQRFARWVRWSSLVFLLCFIYFVIADSLMPLTPQARFLREVTQVAPVLGGRVTEVAVHDHDHVNQGDLLFKIDPEPYHIAVDKAELALEQARRENAELEASLAAARADLLARQADADELAREQQRSESLLSKHNISQQQYDQIQAQYAAAKAQVAAAKARIDQLEVQRGESGEQNLKLRQARNALKQARLNLSWTEVRADQSGVVSNMQLDVGSYANAGSPVMALVGDTPEVVADFREKSLRHIQHGDRAWVSFDAWPGEVFAATAQRIDAGVRDGQLLPNGQLIDIPTTNRWVRDAQRLRLHARFDSLPEPMPASGARVTVQLVPHNHPIAAFFARIQIHVISLMHYVY